MKNPGVGVGERVGEGMFRPGPFESEALEFDFTENGRQDSHRMNGGAGVVHEARQREFGGTATAAG